MKIKQSKKHCHQLLRFQSECETIGAYFTTDSGNIKTRRFGVLTTADAWTVALGWMYTSPKKQSNILCYCYNWVFTENQQPEYSARLYTMLIHESNVLEQTVETKFEVVDPRCIFQRYLCGNEKGLNGIQTLTFVMPVQCRALVRTHGNFLKKVTVDFNVSRFMYEITSMLHYLEVRKEEWNPKTEFLPNFFMFPRSREF